MIKQITNFIKQWQYETAIFTFFMLTGLSVTESFSHVSSWPYAFYLLTYKFGFGSRLLIGTIYDFIFKGHLNPDVIGIITFLLTTFLCLIISIYLGKIIKSSEKSEGNNIGILFLILLYLATPARFSSYFFPTFVGYLEIYAFGLVLLMIYMLLNSKQNVLFWGVLALLSAISMAIHQVFFFILFPIIMSTMIYNLYEKKWDKKTLIGTIFVCLITAISFVYFQFFSSINIPNVDELTAIISKKTKLISSIDYLKMVLGCEYFSTLQQKLFNTMNIAFTTLFKPILLILTIVFFTPLFLIIKNIWNNIYKNCADKHEKKVYVLMQLCTLLFVPVFALACDWGRWFIWLVTFQFVMLYILYWKQSKPALTAIEGFGNFVKNNKFIMGLLLIYYMIFQITLFSIISGFSCLY